MTPATWYHGFVLTRVKTGSLAGSLAVELDCSGLNCQAEGALVALWRRCRCTGAGVVVLTHCPWDNQDFAIRVLELLVLDDASDQTLWAEKAAGDTQWVGGQLWWVLDASTLLRPTAAETLSAVQLLPTTPELAELVVRAPDPTLLRSASLDEIAVGTGADLCWLHVPPQHMQLAMSVCARCTSHWGIRELDTDG